MCEWKDCSFITVNMTIQNLDSNNIMEISKLPSHNNVYANIHVTQ